MALVSLMLLLAAQPVQEPLFDCASDAGRTTVTVEHGLLVYRHRGRTGRGMTLAAAAGSSRVRRYSARYAGPLEQLRFTSGRWSYTVYSMPADRLKGSNAASGVLVRDGLRRVSDIVCRRYSPLHADMAPGMLIEDDDIWTAM